MGVANDQTPVGGDATYAAGADLRTKQNYLVEESTTGTVTVCNNAADRAIGVLINKPNSGQAARVRIAQGSLARVISDGSSVNIGIGDPVGTDGSGKAIKKTTNKDWIIGYAEEASTADGTLISVRLNPCYLAV